jgi:hypothetical protein
MISAGSISSAPISAVSGLLPDTAATLAWLPICAARPVRRHARPSVVPQVILNLSPLPQPPPPTELTWQPQFPIHSARTRSRRLGLTTVIAVPQPPIFTLGWVPILPPRPQARRPTRAPQVIMGDIGAAVVIPTLTAWRTVATAPIRRRAQRQQAGVWTIDATTLMNLAPCVAWTSETLTAPAVGDEAITAPTLDGETVTPPTLSEEDLC